MYKRKRIKLRQGIEVTEYHNGRYGAPGMKRQEKKKATSEEVEQINRYNRERICRMKLMEHFEKNDYFTTLTCRKEERPSDMAEMKRYFSLAMRIIKREYKKRGHEVRWIRNIEVGSRGGWHIHMVINRISDTDLILKKAWIYGKAVSQLMYEQGGFRKLAAYLTKTPKTDKRLVEANYSTSRNLPLPEPEVTICRWSTWKSIRVPKGYYIDAESFREGINRITGYPYRSYTLLKMEGNMSKSRIQREKECYICGAVKNLEEHHIFYGTGKRKKSEHYGLKVKLCFNCHHNDVHAHPNEGHDLMLKRIAQKVFEADYSHKLFMDEFGKNYLEVEKS